MVRYGTLDSSGRPVYAGTTLVVDGVSYANATREMWLAQGKKPFIEAARAPKSSREGFHFERDGWTEQAKAIVPKWKLVADTPPPPKTYVTADVIEALMKAGVWPQVRAFIEERGMLDMVLATKEFRADDPNFTGPRDALKEQLGWTDEQVESVLAVSGQ